MTKLDKLIARFLAEPPEIDFADVRNLLQEFGYSLRKGGSGRSSGLYQVWQGSDNNSTCSWAQSETDLYSAYRGDPGFGSLQVEVNA